MTAVVVVCSTLLAYPFAYAIAYLVPRRWQRLALIMAILPFWTSYVVRSYAWLLALSPVGVVNQFLLALHLIDRPLHLAYNPQATELGFVHFFIMLNALTIYANLVQINPHYAMAARDLGASAGRCFLAITLPLSIPGVAVGAFLTIVLCIGDFVTPQILGGFRGLLLPQVVMMQIQRQLNLPMASVMSLVLTLVVAHRLSPDAALAPDGAAVIGARSRMGAGRAAGLIYMALCYVFIFLPVVVLVLFSFQSGNLPVPPFNGPSLRWYQAAFADGRLVDGFVNSLIVGGVSSALSVLIGFLAAYGIARYEFRGKGVVQAIIILPLAVSYLLIGMGLLVSASALGLGPSLWIVVVGHVVINMPLAFAICLAQLGEHQRRIEAAARDLGASTLRVLVSITAPMIAPALIAAFCLCFTFSWDETLIALLNTRFEVTLPVVILSLLRGGVNAGDQCRRLLHLPLLHPAHDRGRAAAAEEAPMSTTPHLAIEGVRKLYGEVVALDDVSLSVGSQDYVVLLGPSGSGKTTLLSVIGGFTFPDVGQHPDRGARRDGAGTRGTPDDDGVPGLRPVSPYVGGAQHRLRAEAARAWRRRSAISGSSGPWIW